AKHKNLHVIGCHLGSMAFDTDLVAERLDRFPNFAVETSSAISELMDQAREKVRDFFIRYQDRIMYASDISGGTIATDYLIDMSKIGVHWTAEELEKEKTNLLRKYQRDFDYYATGREIPRNGYTIRGLELPPEVLKKIFYSNAVNWVPGIERDFH
ncbi:MAG TPA: amidohydrolase family protein, partial [Cyclobacteriaceae bacterium]|nr:amidohydrolase family protein [Cyclobacteriaceae bacterium]